MKDEGKQQKQRVWSRRQAAFLSFLGLVLLTFWLVTAAVPAMAGYRLATSLSQIQLISGNIGRAQFSGDVPVERFYHGGNQRDLRFNFKGNISTVASIDPSTPLAQGEADYNAGRFADAAATWQQAARYYEQVGDRLLQALSLNYLSLAYQNLGQWQQAEAAINQSLNLLQNQPDLPLLAQAQVLNTRGSLQLETGQTEAALKTWQEAEAAYRRAGDEMGVLGSQINQAQAWQSLGMFQRSQQFLEQVQQALKTQPNSLVKATGLHGLGIVWQAIGDLKQSENILQESLAVAQSLNSPSDMSAALFSLGNTARGLGQIEAALQYYQQAAAKTVAPLNQLEAQLNQLKLLIELKRFTEVQALLPAISANLFNLRSSRDTIYARVNLAESLMQLIKVQQPSNPEIPNHQEIAQLLSEAIHQAKTLNDPRAESIALGTLGKLYEQTQQVSEAQRLTQQALILAQGINATDISYQWYWQLARVLTQQGDIESAITANQQAVDILKTLRSDLVTMNPDVRFSFQEQIEPIYRYLVSLLLQSPSPDRLHQARNAIESLQLAELENFFRTPCLKTKAEQIDTVIEKDDPTAAVIYPIILPDRLAVIVSLAGQPLSQYSTNLPQVEVTEKISLLRQSLNPAASDKRRLMVSQTLYDWLIRPVESQLVANNIKTLVFVLDGELRNIPMAALYDGEQYLIQKYSIALTSGLQLLEPRSLKQLQLRSLTGGLTQARQGFGALPGVESELKEISQKIPSDILLNERFTRKALEKEINDVPFTVVHLATHGQFSSQPEKTFLLTWDERLNANTLSQLLKAREQSNFEPIELLVLSACQTANGDKRAALGLAGLAVRSGVRSTLATLWTVNDHSTAEAIVEFYRYLVQTDSNRAEALRQAQLSLLGQEKYRHPYYWAPFVLVGNWL